MPSSQAQPGNGPNFWVSAPPRSTAILLRSQRDHPRPRLEAWIAVARTEPLRNAGHTTAAHEVVHLDASIEPPPVHTWTGRHEGPDEPPEAPADNRLRARVPDDPGWL